MAIVFTPPNQPNADNVSPLAVWIQNILNALKATFNQVQPSATLGQPNFRVYRNAAQTLSSGVATKINFDTANFDSGSFFDITTNHRFQPTVAGTYVIGGTLLTASSAAGGFATIAIYKNGSQYSVDGELIATGGSQNLYVSITDLVPLNGSTDFVELFAVNSATSPTVQTGSTATVMFGYRIGP